MNRRRKRSKGIVKKVLMFIALFAGTYYVWANAPLKINGNVTVPFITSPREIEVTTAGQTTASVLTDLSDDLIPAPVSEIIDSRSMELINHDYPIKKEPPASLIVSAWPTVPVKSNDIQLHETALEAVRALFDAAQEANVGTFYVSSGYRDYSQQKHLYDSMPDKSFVQLPNHSEHHSGLAVDILAIDIAQSEMGRSGEGIWLAENAWEYGLILRYTEDKRNITQIAGEPWHFRYVGQPHAWYCQQNNLCFEEYIRFLKQNGGYSVTVGGNQYSVLYQMPVNDIINIPESLYHSISGDNTGGYIVTMWE